MRSFTLYLLITACHAAPTFYNGGDYAQTGTVEHLQAIQETCPLNYQPIRDERACKLAAEKITGKIFSSVYHRYNVNPFPDFCTAKTVDGQDVNYYVNPDGEHTDPQVAHLCIKTSKQCSVTNGAGESPTADYPCTCGIDTCADKEVCDLAGNGGQGVCEVMKGYYETERKDKNCNRVTGYQPILDAFACEQVADMLSAKGLKEWGAVYSLNQMPYGCSSWNTNQVNYYVNPPGNLNEEVDVALICIKTSMTCSVTDGTGPSTTYPCVCGQDTCSQNEVCDTAGLSGAGVCEVAAGYYETEREVATCPSGYQVILDAAACREAAGKIGQSIPGTYPHTTAKYWGAVYADRNVPHGCSTWLATRANTVNYYLNPFGVAPYTSDVENALLCIKTTKKCSSTDGTTAASSAETPCVCGTDTCAAGEVCNEAANLCEVIKGYVETERTAKSCPAGYNMINEADCWDLNGQLGRTWIKFPVYSGAGFGCGSWDFDTVTYFDYPSGTAPKDNNLYVNNAPDDTENARLCVNENHTRTYDKCLNPYAWSVCI